MTMKPREKSEPSLIPVSEPCTSETAVDENQSDQSGNDSDEMSNEEIATAQDSSDDSVNNVSGDEDDDDEGEDGTGMSTDQDSSHSDSESDMSVDLEADSNEEINESNEGNLLVQRIRLQGVEDISQILDVIAAGLQLFSRLIHRGSPYLFSALEDLENLSSRLASLGAAISDLITLESRDREE